ncbi:MAG TPA: acyl-CoA dehydrogenase family protein [Sphingopyxis sp.]|nr:acyl-CoA dehydrogenase family protein [Sphingopyxis sp.]
MTILYDEGQLAIATESRRILEARIETEALLPLLEQQGAVHDGFWDVAKQQGWTALALPEAYGGLDLGLIEMGLIAHQAGRSISGAPFLTSSFGAAKAIELYGSDDQKSRYLPALACGDMIGTVAFAQGPDTLAEPSALRLDGDKLSGSIDGVAAGQQADIAILLAETDKGPALALVPCAPAQRSPIDSFDNSRSYAALRFDAAPAETLVNGPQARDAALHILALQAVVTAHEQTGGAEVLMEIARDYANTRKAFGQPIGAFQSIKHRIAEIYSLVELARANCIRAAAAEGDEFLKAAAAARLSATEAYDTAARDCIQIHGGIGVTWELGLHLHMRRARSLAIEQGSSFFWEDILVNELAGEVA